MVYSKYLLPALALASVAVAQSERCSDASIENQSDASGLSGCETITGDLEISDVYTNELILDGIERITGNLICEGGENITSISAPSLASIEGAFRLNGLTRLTNLRFDSLTSVGEIDFEALPRLQNLGFGEGISEAEDVRITNTDLRTLNGIDLESVHDMEITNNPRLETVNVNRITNATGLVSFAANSVGLEIRFPNLDTALNLTVRNATLFEVPSLRRTSGLLGLYSNFFEDFIAPNLTSTGDLVFADNSNLQNISLPVLETVGGAFQIANNTQLRRFNGAPQLTEITGALDFTGNFTEVSLPELDDVGGEFNLQSSGDLDCSGDLDDLESSVRGEFTCEGGVDDPQSIDPTRTGGDSRPTGAAMPFSEPPSAMALLALFGGAAQFLL